MLAAVVSVGCGASAAPQQPSGGDGRPSSRSGPALHPARRSGPGKSSSPVPATGERCASVVRPTLTPFLPKQGTANGTAVVIAPGGAFRFLSWDNEGTKVAEWLSERGVTAFVLKYRLVDTGSTDAELQKSMQELVRVHARAGRPLRAPGDEAGRRVGGRGRAAGDQGGAPAGREMGHQPEAGRHHGVLGGGRGGDPGGRPARRGQPSGLRRGYLRGPDARLHRPGGCTAPVRALCEGRRHRGPGHGAPQEVEGCRQAGRTRRLRERRSRLRNEQTRPTDRRLDRAVLGVAGRAKDMPRPRLSIPPRARHRRLAPRPASSAA